ncbi:MAG: glycosyltransferase family 4 protein [Fibrobacter sp.]|nr:glycosyltransferase family 4 protein [Fibrobacter sp.]
MRKNTRIDTSQKIKILFFDGSVAFGGSVVVLAYLFNNIDRSRFEPLLVSGLDDVSLKALFKPEDVFFHFKRKLNYVERMRWIGKCPFNWQWFYKIWIYTFTIVQISVNFVPWLILMLRLWLHRPDLIHNNNDGCASLVAHWLKIPVVIHLHGLNDTKYYKHPQVKRARRIISISNYVAQEAIKSGLDSTQVSIIPNPAPEFVPDLTKRWEYLAKFGVMPGQVVFGHVGRLIRWKGQQEFLQAFRQAITEYKDIMALIIGDDVEGFSQSYRHSLEQYVYDNNLADQVKFTGHSSEVLRIMSYCDVVVHSSIEPEPFGLVITEAMSAGAAVIASRSGAPCEIIDNMKNGILVDPLNTAEFASAIVRLAKDSDLRQTLAVAGRQMVAERYSPQVFAKDMERIYSTVLVEHRSLKSGNLV